MVRDLRRLADTPLRCARDRRRHLRRRHGLGRGPARAVRGPHRPRRRRRRHVVQQPQDAARRPAIAAGHRTSSRCGASSASAVRWLRIAPHLVRPLPFVIPTTRSPTRNALVMRMALAAQRPRGARPQRGPRRSRPSTCREDRGLARRRRCGSIPWSIPAGLTGGAIWYDYQMTNADRVTFSFALSASAAGAIAANYVSAESLLRGGRPRRGRAGARSRGSERPSTCAPAVVVNAAGAWAPGLVQYAARTAPGAVPAPLPLARDERDRASAPRSAMPAAASWMGASSSWCPGATSRSSARATTCPRGRAGALCA